MMRPSFVQYNSNQDGIIDSNDTNFGDLRLLKGDGSFLSLTEAGIASINICSQSMGTVDASGNYQFAQGTFTKTDGTTANYGEFLKCA